MRRRALQIRAFTMIEMIVALAMVAIIAASLTSTLWTVYHHTRQAEAAVFPSDQASIALDYIADDLQSAMMSSSTMITNQTGLAQNFEGMQATDSRGHEADDIQFFGTAEGMQHIAANGEIKHFQYTVEQPVGSSDYVLVRRVVRNLLYPTVQPAPDEEVICRGVSSFVVQYFDGSNWNTSWDSTAENNELPQAVKVVLELQQTSPDGKILTQKYTRTILLTTSMASLDPQVNSGAQMP